MMFFSNFLKSISLNLPDFLVKLCLNIAKKLCSCFFVKMKKMVILVRKTTFLQVFLINGTSS